MVDSETEPKVPRTAEGEILQIMESEYTPKRAVALGFAFITAAIPLVQYNLFPFAALLGLLFWIVGPTLIVIGVGDWVTRKLPWLRKFAKKELVKIMEGI